jgi:hypothetical protein
MSRNSGSLRIVRRDIWKISCREISLTTQEQKTSFATIISGFFFRKNATDWKNMDVIPLQTFCLGIISPKQLHPCTYSFRQKVKTARNVCFCQNVVSAFYIIPLSLYF